MNFSPSEIKAIIFDLDGVIVDSEPVQEEAARETCQRFGLVVSENVWPSFKGKTDKDMFRFILDRFDRNNTQLVDLIEGKDRLLLEKVPLKIKLLPEVMDFIVRSRKLYSRLGLATSSKANYQRMIFDQWGLHPYFDGITCGDEIVNGKPHPEPYLRTMKKIGMRGEECLVIEDSINGVKAGKSAGCHTVGLTTSFLREQLVEAGADFTVDSFLELADILKFN